mmetsp:Transcript_3816/g.9608  ORF Transcript_3816/g.9608 Transcript_3816/m.9608 type:complete len:489 (+) Transcript_3816:29-1495(+)
MSNKQWADAPAPVSSKRRTLSNDFLSADDLPQGMSLLAQQAHRHDAVAAAAKAESLLKTYQSPSGKLDASVWQAWEEMEGDEDGSGDVAMKTGELDVDKTREHPLGKFLEDPVEGSVLSKTGITPVWCSGYGQNLGVDMHGHVTWEIDVIRRDGNMCVGVVVPSAVDGELDRRWDSKCFADLSFYWATTAGMLMNGQKIVKTLPTKRIPVFHFNPGDTVKLHLKVNEMVVQAEVLSIDSAEMDLFNSYLVKFRLEPIDGKHGKMLESLPALYYGGRVYEPEDYEMLDQTFHLRMREEYQIGQVLEFQFTGELIVRAQDLVIGTFKGVPHDAAPAVCMSSVGDCVRLRPTWGKGDQDVVQGVRANILHYLRNERGRYAELNVAADKRRGLLDWVILKAVRTHGYDTEGAMFDLLHYLSRNTERIAGRNAAEDARRARINLLTQYTDDFKQKDHKIPNMSHEGKDKWNPESVEEALSWQPSYDLIGQITQ